MPQYLWANAPSNSSDIMMADMFGEFWTNFAKFGTPSPNGTWTPVTSLNVKQYYDLGVEPQMREGYRIVDQYVWNQLVPQLVGNWPVEGNITVEPTTMRSVTQKSSQNPSSNMGYSQKTNLAIKILCFCVILFINKI
jgi:hypothetical protein